MSKLLCIAVFLTVITVGLSARCSYNYTTGGHVCVLMNATITVDVLYNSTSGKKEYAKIPVDCDTLDIHNESSTCNKTKIIMVSSWSKSESESEDYYITFEFTANLNSGHQQWSIAKISVGIDVSNDVSNDTDFSHPNKTGHIIGYKDSGLFGSFDNKRSYMCNSANNLSLTMDGEDNINATYFNMHLTIQDFQVQAFQFDHSTGFSNAQRCSQDIKGSKIVPIAVGAALAGLVIIVLIAYIIGRLRSRRQSSYEALS